MPAAPPTLHLLCGKIAAGKSTLARALADAPATVLIEQDTWLSGLYPGEIISLPDYVRFSGRLRGVIGPHVTALLSAGLSVVLDFPANTVATRQWSRSVFEAAGTAHLLHWLDVSDDVCRQRLRTRNAAGTHAYEVTDAEFELFTRHFAAPLPEEGFVLIRHGAP